MIIEGNGLVATAFGSLGDPAIPGLIFARGVSDSSCTDEREYAREMRTLRAAIERARLLDETLVYFAGAPIYGAFSEPVVETIAPAPRTRYGRQQAEAETVLLASGISFLSLRLPNLVGPRGHPHQLVPALVHQVIQGTVTVQQGARRDLLDVADLVRITQQLLVAGVSGQAVNVASGMSTPADAIATAISDVLGQTPEVRVMAGGEAQRFDIGRLRALIGDVTFPKEYPVRTLRRWVPSLAGGTRST